MMTQAVDAQDSISFFVESSSLQRNPEETFTERAYILRILFSIRNLNIDSALNTLHNMGVFIGEYNKDHLYRLHFEQRLSLLDANQTMQLLLNIEVDSYEDIVSEMLAVYEERVNNSPFLCLKRTFEENFGSTDRVSSVVIWLFFALNNWECARDALLVKIFEKAPRIGNHQEVVMKLLGSSLHGLETEKNLETDICIILKFLRVVTTSSGRNFIEPRGDARISADDEVRERTSRFKLGKLRERVVMSNSSKANSDKDFTGSWKPSGLPIIDSQWEPLSKAQQKCVILLSSMAPGMVESTGDMIKILIKSHEHVDFSVFSKYQPQYSETENIAHNIISLLQRFSHVIDVDQSSSFEFVNNFIQCCFESSLGVAQLEAMSLCLKVQIYVSCHLIDRIRKPVYQGLINAFNQRAFHSDSKNQLPNFISSHVMESIDRWSQTEKFPPNLVKQILLPLCL